MKKFVKNPLFKKSLQQKTFKDFLISRFKSKKSYFQKNRGIVI